MVLGIVLATAGWPFAVSQRDSIVGGAQANAAIVANRRGDHLQAALLDLGSNVLLGAVPTSIAGLSVVGPFPIAAWRGWVGGVVSIDGRHQSRLADPGGALYYIVTLVLQLTGYVLTMAAGVHVGVAAWRARRDESIRSVLGLRVRGVALRDAGWLWAAALPAFLVGSLWEFLA